MDPIMLHIYDPQEKLMAARIFRLWGFEPDPEKHYQHDLAQWYRSPMSGPDHQLPPSQELEALWRRLAESAAGRCTALRRGPWLTLRDASHPGRDLDAKLCRLSGKLPSPLLCVRLTAPDSLSVQAWQEGRCIARLTADGTGDGLPMVSRMLGWEVRRSLPDPEALAAPFGWTDATSLRALCAARTPADALPPLTKLMGFDPLNTEDDT